MTTRTWILAALALSLPAAACQSVAVDMGKPRYATRTENLPDQGQGTAWEQAAADAPRGSVRVVPAKPRYASRAEDLRRDGAAPEDRVPAAADRARPAAATVRTSSRVADDADPVIQREDIIASDLPPIADPSTPERGLSDPPRHPAPAAPARPAPPRPAVRPESTNPDAVNDDADAGDDAAAATPVRPTGPTYQYVIQPGDTVAGIGRRFGVHAQTLIELNGLQPHGGIVAGKPLILPASAHDGGPDPYATGPTPSGLGARTAAANSDMESGPRPQRTAPAPIATPASSVTGTGAPSVGRGRFIWPVRGDIVLRYGAMGVGMRNDGINIGAPDGTPVKAAADGEVVYAGSIIAAFGNYVLIKHADGWVTAYGYLSRIDVHMHQDVKQGQIIGAVGSSGGMSQPQLHFEIRYAANPREKADPVDPMPILR